MFLKMTREEVADELRVQYRNNMTLAGNKNGNTQRRRRTGSVDKSDIDAQGTHKSRTKNE